MRCPLKSECQAYSETNLTCEYEHKSCQRYRCHFTSYDWARFYKFRVDGKRVPQTSSSSLEVMGA